MLDASAALHALLGRSAAAVAFRRALVDRVCHAPHLIDAEIGNVLRRRVLRNQLPADTALALLQAGSRIIDRRYPVSARLIRAAWTLRDNLTYYDALYAALAADLDSPLVTMDRRLTRASGLPCRIVLADTGADPV